MRQRFELVGAGLRHGAEFALSGVDLKLHGGEFVAIAGPNGAGKSTLLSLLAGLSAPSEGTCLLDGRDAHRWPRREFARQVAVVLQPDASTFPFTVEEVVAMGRAPHGSRDPGPVNRAMARTETEHFRLREFRTLSAGEKQRVLVACALAQSSEILLLDEPGAHMDLQHQVALHAMLRELSREGMLVAAVTHDLNLAAAYADRLILLQQGQVCADGLPGEVLNAESLETVFQIAARIHHTGQGRPWLVYGA